MTWVVAAVVGGTVVGGYLSSQGQQNAASTQTQAAAQQQGNILAAGQQASQQFTPYAATGTTALANLSANNAYLTTPSPAYKPFTAQDLNANLAPNYAFMLGQGQGATIQNANVGGGGSNVNLANQQFTQNYASNAYQNALTNYQSQQQQGFTQNQAQQTNIYNRLIGEAQLGMAGATGSANAQLGTATNVAQLGIGAANAQAGSQIAQGNIYGGAANTLGNIGAYGAMNSGIQNTAMQNQLSSGGYGQNSLSNFMNNSSTNPSSSSFIGPQLA